MRGQSMNPWTNPESWTGSAELDLHQFVQKETPVKVHHDCVVLWQAAGGYELATEQQGLGLPPFHSVPEW